MLHLDILVGQLLGQALPDDDPIREYVGLDRVMATIVPDLWGHPTPGALALRDGAFGLFSADAKVGDLGLIVLSDENVGALEIAMEHGWNLAVNEGLRRG